MNTRDRRMTMLKPRHYRRLRGGWLVSRTAVVTLSAAAVIGVLIGVAPSLESAAPAIASVLHTSNAASGAIVTYGEPLSGCTVTDGDTIRCGDERIRLLGIDAPELPGHCRPGRNCAPGDPYASTASLEAAMVGTLTIERVGEDHYGRTLAVVAGRKGDLSCWQLAHVQVIYKANWDNGLRVARKCPTAVL